MSQAPSPTHVLSHCSTEQATGGLRGSEDEVPRPQEMRVYLPRKGFHRLP